MKKSVSVHTQLVFISPKVQHLILYSVGRSVALEQMERQKNRALKQAKSKKYNEK